MTKKYDLIIVGAGPAGAMAAKTAGENGLRAAVLERRTNPGKVQRSDSQIFASESYCSQEGKARNFGDRAYYNEESKKIIFPINGFSVDYDGPIRNYYAWHFYAPDGKTRLEYGDYKENIKKGEEGRAFFTFDKGRMIDGLLKEASKNGVDILVGTNVTGIEKSEEGLRVTAGGDTFEGTFVIGADGVNSRVAELMGFNKERTLYNTVSVVSFYITGIKIPQSEACITPIYFKPGTLVARSFFILPSPYGDNEYWMGSSSREEFRWVTKESVFSDWFRDIRVREVQSGIMNTLSPVSEPFKDNVLLVGDAPWYGEAEITGSTMCGWKAAHSVTVALHDGMPNREGVLDYIEWWKRSYPGSEDYRSFMLQGAFRLIFSEEEFVYLFGLVKEPIRSSFSPFKIVKLFKAALEPMMPQIKEEMPSAYEKVKMLEVDNIDKLLGGIKEKMMQERQGGSKP
jgi:digeranylgeranylglycerophospholipid reductase